MTPFPSVLSTPSKVIPNGQNDINSSHSARRRRTSRGRPNLGPYVSFPDVPIRRGRRKDVASMSRPTRTYDNVLRTPGRKKNVRKTYIWAQFPLDVTSEIDALWTTLAEWDQSQLPCIKLLVGYVTSETYLRIFVPYFLLVNYPDYYILLRNSSNLIYILLPSCPTLWEAQFECIILITRK